MSGRPQKQKQSTAKYMGNPLGQTQYFNALDYLEYDKGEVQVKDISGHLPPIILKKYDTINHLNNTTTRLCAELDKQLQ